MGIFNNIGNFGKKVSEYNAQRRDKNLEKLRVKSQSAEVENKKLQEEMQLRKSLEKNKQLKKQVSEQKTAKFRSVIERLNQSSEKHANNSGRNKFDVLGNAEKSPKKKLGEYEGKFQF